MDEFRETSKVAENNVPAAAYKLYTIIAYGQLSAFYNLVAESKTARTLYEQVFLGKIAANHMYNFEVLEKELQKSEQDFYNLANPFVEIFKKYQRATTPSNWPEIVVKAYVGYGLVTDFYNIIVAGLPKKIASIVKRATSELDIYEIARKNIAAEISNQSNKSSQLVLWGRRLLGETTTHLQFLVSADDELITLLFSGLNGLTTMYSFFDELTRKHKARMMNLNLI